MERSLMEIASEVIHYIDDEGNLNVNTKDEAQDLLLMMLLEQIYPEHYQITLSMPN